MTETRIHSLPNGWHLVEHGTWQVSVGPDALIMLPRHLGADDVDHFVAAVKAAGDHAAAVKAMNEENAQNAPPGQRSAIMVTPTGEVPDGYTKIPGVSRNNKPQRAAIGRRGSARAAKTTAPRVPAPPMPPHRGQ